MELKAGEMLDIEIIRVTDEGRGVGFLSNGKMILVDNCTADDRTIKIKLRQVFAETAMAEKISRIKADERNRPDVVDSPYKVDDGEDEEEEADN